jgi:hypothetical protein
MKAFAIVMMILAFGTANAAGPDDGAVGDIFRSLQKGAQGKNVSQPRQAPPAQEKPSPRETPEEKTRNTKLERVFDPEMLGADVAYFEQVTGPARNTYRDGTKIYKIGDCEVTAAITGGSITSLGMGLSPQCTFDLNKFLSNSSDQFPFPHTMTFGKFNPDCPLAIVRGFEAN